MSKRKATEKKKPEVIELSSDSDHDESIAKRLHSDLNVANLDEFEHKKSSYEAGDSDFKIDSEKNAQKEDDLFKNYFYLTKVNNVRHSNKINEHYSISLTGIFQ
jgi:hypothetical protein